MTGRSGKKTSQRSAVKVSRFTQSPVSIEASSGRLNSPPCFSIKPATRWRPLRLHLEHFTCSVAVYFASWFRRIPDIHTMVCDRAGERLTETVAPDCLNCYDSGMKRDEKMKKFVEAGLLVRNEGNSFDPTELAEFWDNHQANKMRLHLGNPAYELRPGLLT